MAGGDEEAKLSWPFVGGASLPEASSTSKTKGWLNTAFAEEMLLTSLELHVGQGGPNEVELANPCSASLARSAFFSCLWVRSTRPLACGW
jgi:hypothetical protein